jgi:glycosyltransferase involved in cell wall biosynthesis
LESESPIESDVTPLVSVIMPVWNGAHFLERALGALQRSSFRDFEIIVVDDGSDDQSALVARKMGAQVLSSGVRQGVGAARNFGVQSARGSILAFVDADVAVHEDALEKIVKLLVEDESLSAVYGRYDDVPADQSTVSRFRNLLHAHVHNNASMRAATFWGGLGAVRREAFFEIGGFVANQKIEDVEFGLRLRAA